MEESSMSPQRPNQAAHQPRAQAEAQTPAFIHSYLDDYGLSAPVFRVYCHLARRAGSGIAWPSVTGMARVCRLHPQTVRKALVALVRRGFVTPRARPGKTTIYQLTPISAWQPSTPEDGAHRQTGTHPSDSQSSPPTTMQPHPSETNAVEGNPAEGNPKKGIQVPPYSPKGESLKARSLDDSQAEAIYDAYPKKVAKPNALRAIRRALKRHSFERLLERTKLFAQTCDREPRYIPNPSTFFNQERFADDPSTWRRGGSAGGSSRPRVISPDQFGRGVGKL
jgi:Helix-turn-helix domain